MKKTIEVTSCDICKMEKPVVAINYPVIFTTDQTEGRPCKPYISQEKIDVCEACKSRILTIEGYGAQGCNTFRIKPKEDAHER